VKEYLAQARLANEEKKSERKKNFSQVFDNPLKGFPYNEEIEVTPIKEGNMQVEGDPYVPQRKGVNKNIANYWNKEIKGLTPKELESIQSMYMITDHSGVVQMYKAGKRDFIKSIKEEVVLEDYKKVIKMYPRDNDWKKLITKHKRAIDDFRKNNKDLPSKVEDELIGWASQTGAVGHKDDVEDFIMSILDEKFKPSKEETISEAKNLMPEVQKIVDTKGAAKVGGVMLDMFTASVLTQAYAKVNDANKKKMESSNIQTLVKLAQRVMGLKEETTLTEGMSKLLSPAQQAGVLKKWNEPEGSTFAKEVYSNAKIANKKDFIVTSHPVKDGDYYLSLLGNKKEGELDNELVKANTNMNADIRKICAKWSKSKDRGYNPAGMAYLQIEKELCDKKYNNFAAADTMVRDVVWGMVEDLMNMKIKTA
jgi:hypothetical protein